MYYPVSSILITPYIGQEYYFYFHVYIHLPHSFNAAMVRALKALQAKISNMELDRVMAGERRKHLSDETQRHAQFLECQEKMSVPSCPIYSSDKHGWLMHTTVHNTCIVVCSVSIQWKLPTVITLWLEMWLY